jgi:hypothetical protein
MDMRVEFIRQVGTGRERTIAEVEIVQGEALGEELEAD